MCGMFKICLIIYIQANTVKSESPIIGAYIYAMPLNLNR